MSRGDGSYRLFLAVKPGAQVTKALLELQTYITGKADGLKWICGQNLHLTLRFIGSLQTAELPILINSLKKLKFEPFELEVNGLGVFKRAQQSILWAGVVATDPLRELKEHLEQLLEKDCGLIGVKGGYRPHITLARLKRSENSLAVEVRLETLRLQMQQRSFGNFSVAGFSLFKSELRPQGAIYTVIHNYP